MIFKTFSVALIIGLMCSTAYAEDIERKERLVEEYFRILDFGDSMQEMLSEIAKGMGDDQQEFIASMNEHMNMAMLEEAAKKILIAHLTEEELAVFVEFVSRPEGKSALDKMKFYMADINPVYQKEIQRAYKIYLDSKANKN